MKSLATDIKSKLLRCRKLYFKPASVSESRTFLSALILLLVSSTAFSQTPVEWGTSGNSLTGAEYIGTNNNTDFIIRTNGSTALKLKANGQMVLKDLEGLGNGIVLFDNNGKFNPLLLSGNPSEVLLGDGTFGTMPGTFTSGSSGKIFYTGGKVGIGTSSPNFKLDVDGDMRVTQNLYLQGQLVIAEKIETAKEMKARSIQVDSILMDSTAAFYGTSTFNDNVEMNERLNVDGDLNVLGNASIMGNLSTMGNFTFASNKTIGVLHLPSGAEARLFGPSVLPVPIDPCIFPDITNVFEGMLQSSGVNSDGYTNVMSMGFDGANAIIDLAGANNSTVPPRLLMNYYCGKDIHMCTGANGGSVFMATAASGKVGIGEEYVPAGYKLAVKGKIISEEVFVALRNTWPDYVFSKEYKLRSISELQSFISANKHLPGLPSAAEIENAQGLALGEFQAKILEKIEEQALYIIQLNNRLNAVETENTELKKVLSNR
jgi:hypothetical protein